MRVCRYARLMVDEYAHTLLHCYVYKYTSGTASIGKFIRIGKFTEE